MKHDVPPLLRTRARQLRTGATQFERQLWRLLRERLPWAKFRRQVPICAYVVDFLCFEARLIVELDGEGHGLEIGRRYDRVRDETLRGHGFTMLRLWNNALAGDPDGTVETIRGALETGGVTTPATGEPAGRGFRTRRRRRMGIASSN